MKIVAVGDIHGCLDQLKELIQKVNTYLHGQDFQFVFLGDYVDRGPKIKETLQFLLEFQRERNYQDVFILGNHDEMFLDYNNGIFVKEYMMDYPETVESYKDGIPDSHIKFLRNCELYFNCDRYIFVHAGIDPSEPDMRNQSKFNMLWERKFNSCLEYAGGWKVVHGHTPVYKVVNFSDQVFLDTGCVFGGKLSAMIIDTGLEIETIVEVDGWVKNRT